MKAYVLHGVNDIKSEDIKKPIPGNKELLIKVKAAGICGSDIPRIYQNGAHKHPIVLGHEFSGIVEDAGTDANSNYIGKRVGVFPLIPCGKCNSCLKKKYEMCENYDYLGSRSDGAFAEYVTVPEKNVIEIPDSVSLENAAMLEPFAVSAHAVRAVVDESTSKDVNILVWGLGTIGIMVAMLLKSEGFTNIYCACNKDFQVNFIVDNLGIAKDNVLNIAELVDPVKGISAKAGVEFDICFECVGSPETVNCVVDATGRGGKVMLVGNPYSDIKLKRDVYWKILRNQLEIHGTWNSSFTGEEDDDWHYIVKAMELNKLNPECLITQRFSLDSLENGFISMRDKTSPYIKMMLTI